MMTSRRNLNFVPRSNSLRLKQAGALSAVILCAVMLGATLRSGGKQTATLSDSLGTPTPSTVSDGIATRPKVISENQVVSVSPGKERDSVRYYERGTGKAFAVNLKTLRTDTLSDVRLSGFIRSYWLPYSDSVVSEFQEPDGISYRWFDYRTKETGVIGSDITALTVSPDGRQIAYMQLTKDASELFVSDSNGAHPRRLLTTRAQDVHLDWPTKEALSMSSRRADRTGTDLSIIDMQGALVVVLSNLRNLEYTWSPDGARLLYSYYTDERGVSLRVRDIGSGEDVALNVGTSARKCAWHGQTLTITCGVPSSSSLGADVSAEHSSTIDDIVTIDMETGERHRAYAGTSAALIGAIEPLVSSSESYFVFTNVFDQRLYVLPI